MSRTSNFPLDNQKQQYRPQSVSSAERHRTHIPKSHPATSPQVKSQLNERPSSLPSPNRAPPPAYGAPRSAPRPRSHRGLLRGVRAAAAPVPATIPLKCVLGIKSRRSIPLRYAAAAKQVPRRRSAEGMIGLRGRTSPPDRSVLPSATHSLTQPLTRRPRTRRGAAGAMVRGGERGEPPTLSVLLPRPESECAVAAQVARLRGRPSPAVPSRLPEEPAGGEGGTGRQRRL